MVESGPTLVKSGPKVAEIRLDPAELNQTRSNPLRVCAQSGPKFEGIGPNWIELRSDLVEIGHCLSRIRVEKSEDGVPSKGWPTKLRTISNVNSFYGAPASKRRKKRHRCYTPSLRSNRAALSNGAWCTARIARTRKACLMRQGSCECVEMDGGVRHRLALQTSTQRRCGGHLPPSEAGRMDGALKRLPGPLRPKGIVLPTHR